VLTQRETERKRLTEEQERERQKMLDAAGLRSEQRAIRSLGGTQVARAGEQVAGPMPSAIPLSGVGNAFAAAEKAGGPATSRGALRQEVGGESFILPSMAEMEAMASERKQATSQQERDDENRRDFETFTTLYGGKGEYNPRVNYSQAIKKAETQASRGMTEYQRQSLALERQKLGLAAGGAPGASGAPGGRRTAASRAEQISTLPTVTNVAESLNKLTDKDIKGLSGMGVAAAAKVPMLLTSSRGGFADIVSLPAAAGFSMLSDEKDKAYAENVRAVGDAVASMVTAGVMTDQDIGRFQAQVLFNPNESDEGKVRKFNNLKLWAAWLGSGGEGKSPGESDQAYLQRTSMMRRGGASGGTTQATTGADTRTPAQRLWDEAVAEEGLEKVLRDFGPRP
jgi:hypothetical protein